MKEWKALSREVLAEAGYRCQCEEHQGKYLLPRATDVHHIIPHLGNTTRFWDKQNLQALAHKCHSAATMKANARWR